MKKLILLPFACLSLQGKAQSIPFQKAYPTYLAYNVPVNTAYANVITAVGTDTTFSNKSGTVSLKTGYITIDGTVYTITNGGVVQADGNNQFWETMTLNGNIECTLRRYPNYALMNIILTDANNNTTTYFIR